MATYEANAECANCGWTGAITPEKGTAVGDALCPTCEVEGQLNKA